MAGLDHYVDFIGYCVHGASTVWHSNTRCIDNFAYDFLRWAGANVVVARIVDGDSERHSYGQSDGQSWHT